MTDEPCPKCGASLDLTVTPPELVPGPKPGSMQERETIRLDRILVCPECGWTRKE
jgi:hypothetical protein